MNLPRAAQQQRTYARAWLEPVLGWSCAVGSRLKPLVDPVVILAVVWALGYALVAALAGRSSAAPQALPAFWLLPSGPVVAFLAFRLARDGWFRDRDRLPWGVLAVAGLLMPVRDVLLVAGDAGVYGFGPGLATVATVAELAVVAIAVMLFRPDVEGWVRPLGQFILDLACVAITAALLIQYFVIQPLPPASGNEFASRIVFALGAVVTMTFFAATAIRPTKGISHLAATILVLSGGAAVVATSTAWLGTSVDNPQLGLVCFALLRCGLIAACQVEFKTRWHSVHRAAESGPSLIFYLSVAFGAIPLLTMVLNQGSQYLTALCLSVVLFGLLLIRQAMTVRQASELDRARRKTEARFGWLVSNSSDLIMAVDSKGAIEYASPSVERLLQHPNGKLLGIDLTSLAHPDDVAELGRLIERATASPGQGVVGEWRMGQPDGSWLPVETVATSGSGDFDTPGVVLNTRDLQERKALEQKLTFQAFHDPLTRLANRNLFRERVEHTLDRRTVGNLAVLFIDLDNFKPINDSLGHEAGDHVLVETGHRLRSAIRAEDTAARVGGDEFAVLLEDADLTTAARIAERIQATLGTPFWVLGQEVFISASIGIAAHEPGETVNELLRNADVAMYTAKTKGKARFEIFEARMHDAVVARLGLEAELRRAIEHEEFVVYYQPIVRLGTGEVMGAEALVRWQHPTRGLVPPMEFIPLAEETGLILPLGAWILRQACRQLADWQRVRGGGEAFVMNVNLSSRQLMRESIADEVAAAIDESGIRASWLTLEVTETVLMADPVVAASALTTIRALGVRVALDDFGSGYSSLSHLRRFPIDIVKIDKSFVDDVATDGVESAIARSIIDLGRAMQIKTVAEGIEEVEQAETLRSLGCEYGQGYLFAKPLDPSQWQELLASGVAGDPSVAAADAAGRTASGRTAAAAGPKDPADLHRRRRKPQAA